MEPLAPASSIGFRSEKLLYKAKKWDDYLQVSHPVLTLGRPTLVLEVCFRYLEGILKWSDCNANRGGYPALFFGFSRLLLDNVLLPKLCLLNGGYGSINDIRSAQEDGRRMEAC